LAIFGEKKLLELQFYVTFIPWFFKIMFWFYNAWGVCRLKVKLLILEVKIGR